MKPEALKRYARHLVLKEIGGPGQQALGGAKIVIIGAGGLGGPAGLYLAAAGAGHICLIDDDTVELSNLQRQIQFQTSQIGLAKTKAMSSTLSEINPEVHLETRQTRLIESNAASLLEGFDIILDGTDSFETRFLVNHISLEKSIPLVSGAIGRFDGQVSVFNTAQDQPCYQCLVPVKPPQSATCSDVGVVGALAGMVGSLMALEAIKLITGAGVPLTGRLWIFDGLTGESRTVGLFKDPACPVCSHR